MIQPFVRETVQNIDLDIGINANGVTAQLQNADSLDSIPPPQSDHEALALSLSTSKVSMFAATRGGDMATLRHTPHAFAYYLGLLYAL